MWAEGPSSSPRRGFTPIMGNSSAFLTHSVECGQATLATSTNDGQLKANLDIQLVQPNAACPGAPPLHQPLGLQRNQATLELGSAAAAVAIEDLQQLRKSSSTPGFPVSSSVSSATHPPAPPAPPRAWRLFRGRPAPFCQLYGRQRGRFLLV